VNITSPGLYPDIPEPTYHADPVPAGSFSSTMAKQILKSPAHLRHYLDSPRVEKAAFDFGHAVHAEVLGVGLEVEVMAFDSWRTKAAQTARDEARAAGLVPLLEHEYEPVRRAVEAVRAHPIAGPLFAGAGLAEQSAFAVDPDTGLWLRARFDWTTPGSILVDLKTANDGAPQAFRRVVGDLGYDVQDAFYRHAYELATGERPRGFIFVTVEKAAPHLVDVHELDADWQALGRQKMRRAIDTYKRCLDTGEWPGRPARVNTLSAPLWLIDQEEEADD